VAYFAFWFLVVMEINGGGGIVCFSIFGNNGNQMGMVCCAFSQSKVSLRITSPNFNFKNM